MNNNHNSIKQSDTLVKFVQIMNLYLDFETGLAHVSLSHRIGNLMPLLT